jgi:hypothetical protein
MSRITRKISIAAITITFIVLFGMMSSVSADTMYIYPTTGTPNVTRWEGNETANLSPAEIATKVGYVGSLEELYKKEVDGGLEFGSYAGSYETTFSSDPDDPSAADIVWQGIPNTFITGPPIYLYVKDGSTIPAWYIFNLYVLGWDGMDTLALRDFWPDNGAISHVAILGTTPVPEPGILILLGIAMTAVGVASRYMRKP